MAANGTGPDEPQGGEAGEPARPDGEGSRARAVSDLFRAHNRMLVRFLEVKLRDEQEAREVAQEAYVRLLELERTGAVSFLRAYLFKIAANLAIDRLRSHKTRQRIDAAVVEPVENLIDQEPVEKRVFAADDMRVFWASLQELPEPYQSALELNRLQGLSTAEIAKRMGKSERMVRRYIVHALIYCRHRLNGLAADEAKERMGHE